MRLTPNRPFTTPEAVITIDGGLAPGAHRFRLEVVGERSGLQSKAMEVVVRVQPRLPTPIPVPIPIPVPPIIR